MHNIGRSTVSLAANNPCWLQQCAVVGGSGSNNLAPDKEINVEHLTASYLFSFVYAEYHSYKKGVVYDEV
jgi:hypothetical protein